MENAAQSGSQLLQRGCFKDDDGEGGQRSPPIVAWPSGRRGQPRRSNVVGIVPNEKATLRVVGDIPIEQDDEWAAAERRYFSAESMKHLRAPLAVASDRELLMAIA